MNAGKDEDREDAFVFLRRAVHDRLAAIRALIRVTFKLEHQHLNHVPVPRGCGQVNGLRAQVTIAMLGHGSLSNVIILKLLPHRIEDQNCLLEAHELK